MKVMITGASGFLGGHLVARACAAYGPKNVLAMSSRPNSRCDTIIYNPVDFRINAEDIPKLAEVEVVIHAGAYTPKSASGANLIGPCTENIWSTAELLKLPLGGLQKIIFLSTLDVYSDADNIAEATPTSPSTLYGMSKLYCERIISTYASDQHISCQVIRVGHVYGPGEEKYQKLIPKAIANIVAGEPVELWGDGADLRSFIYVEDVVTAILAAVNLHEDVGVINVVSGRAVSIRQVLNALIEISGKRVDVISREFNGPRRDYVFDNTKLKSYLLAEETELMVGLRAEYEYVAGLR